MNISRLPEDVLPWLVAAAPALRKTCRGLYTAYQARPELVMAKQAVYRSGTYRGFDVSVWENPLGVQYDYTVIHDYHRSLCRMNCSRNIGQTTVHVTGRCDYNGRVGDRIIAYLCDRPEGRLENLDGILPDFKKMFATNFYEIYVGGRSELNYYVDYDYELFLNDGVLECGDKPDHVPEADAIRIGEYLRGLLGVWVDPREILAAGDFERLPGALARRDCSGDVHEYISD
jgi:hypothetical protein